MVKLIINIVLILILALLTWLGLGPILFEDGASQDKAGAVLTVSFLYLVIFAMMFYINRNIKNKNK